MSSPRAVGSQINLAFQPKFPTFTPDTFKRILDEKGFTISQAQATSPQGQQMQVQTFSKGNLVIALVPNPVPQAPPQIAFQVLNTASLMEVSEGTPIIDTIKDILAKLNIEPDSVGSMVFNCITAVTTAVEPIKVLTLAIKSDLLSGISKALGMEPLSVGSIVLGTAFPLTGNGLEVRLEPLVNNPQKQYYVSVVLRTDDMGEFDMFIRRFEKKVVEEIIQLVGKHV
ncbi:MAG: hypothetical protein LYZ66_04750 [Nitrososphaerales archaeon]|nr:hypothetical protein [Nitrososphaerales archaeon]